MDGGKLAGHSLARLVRRYTLDSHLCSTQQPLSSPLCLPLNLVTIHTTTTTRFSARVRVASLAQYSTVAAQLGKEVGR